VEARAEAGKNTLKTAPRSREPGFFLDGQWHGVKHCLVTRDQKNLLEIFKKVHERFFDYLKVENKELFISVLEKLQT
jgi:hypothetical protein